MWFKKLTGFQEESPDQVRAKLKIDGCILTSQVNGKSYQFGNLETPTLEELKKMASSLESFTGKIRLSEVVGNVQTFHQKKENEGALFQAASQFNLLEMVNPYVTPEKGVSIYENDHTQGPACAIACGAGTIYRNYFANVNGEIGQRSDNQIDCLGEIGSVLGNENSALWEMKNGYALASEDGLKNITTQIESKSNGEYEALKGKLRIGIQWDTEVTINESKQIVTQAYCSALPVAYSSVSTSHWTTFATLILEATYEATLYAALLNFTKTGNNKVFLTLVGGGAFGNNSTWISGAILKSISKFSNIPLDVKIVSYSGSDSVVRNIVLESGM